MPSPAQGDKSTALTAHVLLLHTGVMQEEVNDQPYPCQLNAPTLEAHEISSVLAGLQAKKMASSRATQSDTFACMHAYVLRCKH